MSTAFDRWEKDPFFYAAEEVQESADRMESVFRRWIIHEKRPIDGIWNLHVADLQRELNTALGIAKWQLEELEKAVGSSDRAISAGESTRNRHSDFVNAISCKISTVENALKGLNREEDSVRAFSWVTLDEDERDALALFLTPPKSEMKKVFPTLSGGFQELGNRMNGDSCVCFSNSCRSNESNSLEKKVGVSADLGVLEISVSSELSPWELSVQRPNLPIGRILSFSNLRTVEETSDEAKWYRHGFRKWKDFCHGDMEESIPLSDHHLQGVNICYTKKNSCLRDCSGACIKLLYGLPIPFLRHIQRSQYQIQYGRPTQLIIWTFVAVLFIVLWTCELRGR